MPEFRKVNKLMAGWNVSGLSHLSSVVQCQADLKNDFETCVTFLAGQLAHQSMKHGPTPGRNVSSLSTGEDSNGEGTRQSKLEKKQAREILALKAKLAAGGTPGKQKPKRPVGKVDKGAKYNPSKPSNLSLIHI